MDYQKLFDYMSKEHGVHLLESEMQEIISICKEISKGPIEEVIWNKKFPNTDFNPDDFYDWAAENANEALNIVFNCI